MEFGERSLSEAAGAILAHSVALPGGRLRKGVRLGDAELAALRAAGIERVTVARLGVGDVHEDEAALAVARALVPDVTAAGLVLKPVGTGRVNVHSTGPGVLRLDAARVAALNGADPAITLATLPEWQRVMADEMVATVKIIAYGVPRAALDAACAGGDGAIALSSPRIGSAMLIQTTVEGAAEEGKLVEKGRRTIAERLSRLGVTLGVKKVVPHRTAALADAISEAADAEMILILTGSATSDPRDVAPEALRRAGGAVAHVGMPVDPGNLLFLGSLGPVPVIGLPGCVRSPALNGADWVMERIICGVTVTPQMITGMGVGGLLKEIPQRPQPRQP